MTALLLWVSLLLGGVDPTTTPTPACVEDEHELTVQGHTVCVHVEGDGWRVVR